jgi:hypothetical protein
MKNGVEITNDRELWQEFLTAKTQKEFLRQLKKLCGGNVPKWLGAATA